MTNLEHNAAVSNEIMESLEPEEAKQVDRFFQLSPANRKSAIASMRIPAVLAIVAIGKLLHIA